MKRAIFAFAVFASSPAFAQALPPVTVSFTVSDQLLLAGIHYVRRGLANRMHGGVFDALSNRRLLHGDGGQRGGSHDNRADCNVCLGFYHHARRGNQRRECAPSRLRLSPPTRQTAVSM